MWARASNQSQMGYTWLLLLSYCVLILPLMLSRFDSSEAGIIAGAPNGSSTESAPGDPVTRDDAASSELWLIVLIVLVCMLVCTLTFRLRCTCLSLRHACQGVDDHSALPRDSSVGRARPAAPRALSRRRGGRKRSSCTSFAGAMSAVSWRYGRKRCCVK